MLNRNLCAVSREQSLCLDKSKTRIERVCFNTNFLDFFFSLKAGFDCMEFPTAG